MKTAPPERGLFFDPSAYVGGVGYDIKVNGSSAAVRLALY
jgi:hypothetical protein